MRSVCCGACAQTGAGGYYNRVAKLVMQGVLFENNTAQAGAGALEMNLCSGDVQTCVFTKNKARARTHPLPACHHLRLCVCAANKQDLRDHGARMHCAHRLGMLKLALSWD